MSSYTGKVVRIEGLIVEVCPFAGCYVKLLDKSGQIMNLKVDDGTYDFRLVTRPGNYAVGEGLPSPTGDHGPAGGHPELRGDARQHPLPGALTRSTGGRSSQATRTWACPRRGST